MTQIVADNSSMAGLAAENQRLRARMDALLEQIEQNHAVMCRHQAFDLDLVGAASFPALIGTIFRCLPAVSQLERVTLSLLDEDDDISTVMTRLGVDFSLYPDLMFVHDDTALGLQGPEEAGAAPARPLLGPFDAAQHDAIFGHEARLRSVALVPLLRNRRLIGSLNLGSADPARFTPTLGTGAVEHMASIIAICLENVISNEMLKYIGLTDSLTGVYNRRYIDRRLQEEIARARRQEYQLSCMYIDIDFFKQVNDSVGHQGGDEVLREVAARIKNELRLSDAVGRFGGEEFVVLLIDADLASACQVAERIRASVAGSAVELAAGVEVRVSVSIGVASLAQAVQEQAAPIETVALELLAHADRALYRAKAGGRNQVVSFHAS